MPSFEHLHLFHLHSDLYLMNHPKQLRTYFHINFQDAWKLLLNLGIDGRASQLGEQKNSFFLEAFLSCSSPWNGHNPRGTWKLHHDWILVTRASQDSTRPYLGIKNPLLLRKKLLCTIISAVGCWNTFQAELDAKNWEIRQFSRKTTPVQLWALPASQGWRFLEHQARSCQGDELVGCACAALYPR